ncbi:MAG TPA: MerR family transcriptional regulator [Deltaproteobacteria bacterium]|nr:MerR family transcriptional regulator [Deltaproteobacteria bacterium]HQB37920.1 MerR family transcriptional regulator [Deltaproteobacteria bacterium]
MSTALPDKLFYKIGEVAQLAGVRTSVLRFWETEFEFLKPEKSSTGQRLYTNREVELILEVRRLLYDQKFTIEGVKQRITPRGRIKAADPEQPVAPSDLADLLKEIRTELVTIRNSL